MILKKSTAVITAVMMLVGLVTVGLLGSEQVFADSREFISCGSYPQTQVEVTSALENASYDANGDAEIDGVKYRRVEVEVEIEVEAEVEGDRGWYIYETEYRYFMYEPILWEKIADGTYLAKNIIDCQPYNDEESQYIYGLGRWVEYTSDTSWDECTLRTWLSNEFYTTAFSADERSNVSDVTLISLETAKTLSSDVLAKSCTDYAASLGVAQYVGDINNGNGKWFLQDVSPVMNSVVCFVTEAGSPNSSSLKILANNRETGIVPCITLNSDSSVDKVTESYETTTLFYAPSGKVISVSDSTKYMYAGDGWYESSEEAESHLYEVVNSNFMNSSAYSEYTKYITSMATERRPYICMDYGLEYGNINAGGTEIVDFLKPIADACYTGKQDDFTEIKIYFYYNSDSDFANIRDSIFDTVHAAYAMFGRVVSVNSGGDSSGTSSRPGTSYQLLIDLKVNGMASYSVQESNYFMKLYEVADGARAYSDSDLGRIQYIRNYFAENVVYNGNVFGNSPYTIMLDGDGVCGSYANALRDLCYILDIPCFVVTSQSMNHGWNRIYLDGDWYETDTTGIVSAAYEVNGLYNAYDADGWNESLRASDVSFMSDLEYPSALLDVSDADFAYMEKLFANLSTHTDKTANSTGFDDVSISDYYFEPVLWAVDKEITTGTTVLTFSPDNMCTTSQILTFLWRASGSPSATISNPFKDVSSSDYYYQAALWAYENGLVSGTTFNGSSLCTRSATVTYFWKLEGSPGASGSSFTDVSSGADYASAVSWAVANGITEGTSTRTFSPDDTCTRAQIVTFLYRYMG